MRTRWIVVGAAIIGAVAFALSVYGGAWWSIQSDGASVQIGPYSSQRCFGGDCAPAGLGWIGANERWLRIGTATWAAGLISMVVLLALAGAVAAKRRPTLVAKSVLTSIGAAALAGVAFIVLFPGMPGASLGRGVMLYAVAIVAAAYAAIRVLRSAPAPTSD